MPPIPPLNILDPIFSDEDIAMEFLFNQGIFPKDKMCTPCGTQMALIRDKSKFRCPTYVCRKQISIRKGTFFFGQKLSCSKILFLGYLWLNKVPVTTTISMTRIGSATAASFYKYFRQLVSDAVELEDAIIGGNDVIVEIDEAKMGKRKYNQGHKVEGAWVLGGVERMPERRVFLVEVKDRKGDLLGHIIKKHVKPGSIIYTDLWKGYNVLDTNENYEHYTVNHSKNFKDPITGVHTNTIEGTWNGLKMQIKPRNRTKRTIDEHLWEFIWRRNNKNDLWNGFINAPKEVEYLSD